MENIDERTETNKEIEGTDIKTISLEKLRAYVKNLKENQLLVLSFAQKNESEEDKRRR
ncbi:MAG: hypothetical protein RR869_10355 [Lachnospiraceae bacterium]